MGERKLPQMIGDLRTDLGDLDPENQKWSTTQLHRDIQRAVSDFSRFLPRDVVYEKTLIFTIEDEAWTSASAYTSWATLANKPIKWNTETVKNNAGTECVRDTDYYIDYANGKIQAISGGLIGTGESCTISYTVSQLVVDLSTLTDMIRIDRVVYPVGSFPVNNVTTELYGTFLHVTGYGESEGQVELTENNHIAVYYSAHHTVPTEDDAGSYPTFLEDTILLAAGAYALFQYSLTMHHLAYTALQNADTALGAVTTALSKVATYLEENTNENAKYWLTKITTDIADLRTAIKADLDALNNYLDVVGDATTGDLDKSDAVKELYMGSTANYLNGGSEYPDVKKAIADGAALLGDNSTGGEGQEVQDTHRKFAESTKSALLEPFETHRKFLQDNAGFRIQAASVYASGAQQRLSNLRSYIEQAGGWRDIALTFIQEGTQQYSKAVQYTNDASQLIALGEKYHEDGQGRRDEAWAIWRDRRQYIGEFAASSIRQMPNYS